MVWGLSEGVGVAGWRGRRGKNRTTVIALSIKYNLKKEKEILKESC